MPEKKPKPVHEWKLAVTIKDDGEPTYFDKPTLKDMIERSAPDSGVTIRVREMRRMKNVRHR